MKKKSSYLAVAITAALFSSNTYSASADVTPAPAPTFDSFKAAQEQYKRDREAFVAALRDRDMQMRSINATFKNAVDKATSDAKTAMASANTPDLKNSINSTRRASVASAIVARESAIAALGPVPTPPVEPVKPPKGGQIGMNDQKGKQKR
jgi:Na+-transporting NADH:ubiquinone oxidoreductase subunit NqrC